MDHSSRIVSIHPYFKAKPGRLADALAMLPRLAMQTSREAGVIQYDFTVNGDAIFCRESYRGAEGLLAHCGNVGELFEELLQFVDITRVEVHGSAGELEKLKPALQHLDPEWFVYQCGIDAPSEAAISMAVSERQTVLER